MKKLMKKYLPDRRQVLCILCGVLLAALAFRGRIQEAELEEGYLLVRPEPGEEARTEEILAQGPEGEAVLPVVIGARQYTESAAVQEMDRAADRLGESLAGENASLQEVRKPLVFAPSDSPGIYAEWQPADSELIDSGGLILQEEVPEEGRDTEVKLLLRTEAFVREYSFPVRVYPLETDAQSRFVRGLSEEIRREDRAQATAANLRLPADHDGTPLSYRRKVSGDWKLFPVLGVLAAALMPLLDRQREKEKKRDRDLQMMKDYPEIISRLVVYTGAGLPVRKAWEKIAAEYEKTEGGHFAYDEMTKACHMMRRGVPEIQAYESFAAACRSQPYRKLAGLLSQNIRNGSEKLREALELEMENAFEQRKNLARRQGEQASTKLLLPLLLMLMIVMVMVSVPAFLAFGL